jgi:hypothetical protein
MSVLERAADRSSNPDIVEKRIRKRITEVVRAYRHSWDVFSELIQNSIDSINRRYKVLNDPDFYLYDHIREQYDDIESDPSYEGKIKIIVDVDKNILTIKDNGTGIEKENLEDFLLPESTDKVAGTEYGFKGYGLTFAAFISKELSIRSKHFLGNDTNKLALDGLVDWLASPQGEIDFPKEPVPDAESTEDELDDWNTEISVKLSDNYSEILPAISAADQAFDIVNESKRSEDGRPQGFEYVLRTRTAVGNTKPLFNSAPEVQVDVSLDVKYSGTEEFQSFSVPYSFYHPKENSELNVSSYHFPEYIDKYKRTTFDRNFRSLYHIPNNVQKVGTRKIIDCRFAICAVAQNRLNNVEDNLGLSEIDTGDVDITYGVHLSIDGMPTGLRIDDWDTKGGYIKRYFVVVDAELNLSDQLDPGRKGISNYFASLISDRALKLINNEEVDGSDSFSKYASKHLDHGRGGGGGGLPPQEFQRMVDQIRETGEEQPDHLVDLVRQYSRLLYCPTDEQEVIALFYQLLKSNIIKGYKTVYQAATRAVYDAAFEYEIDCSSSNNLYPQDPIGVGQVLVEDLKRRGESKYVHSKHHSGQTALPEVCVEFKKSVGGFLDELHNRSGQTSKTPKDIDILIVWNTDISVDVPQNMFTIDKLSDNKRIFHGVTHRLGIIGQEFANVRVISLLDVLKFRNSDRTRSN